MGLGYGHNKDWGEIRLGLGTCKKADLKITYTPGFVWHGQLNLATISTSAGEYSSNYQVSNMFDSDIKTLWISAQSKRNQPKKIAVNFRQSIKFSEITIIKDGFRKKGVRICIHSS